MKTMTPMREDNVSVRKIANGYLVSQWTDEGHKEVYSKDKPTISVGTKEPAQTSSSLAKAMKSIRG